jgi:hypothetical protein
VPVLARFDLNPEYPTTASIHKIALVSVHMLRSSPKDNIIGSLSVITRGKIRKRDRCLNFTKPPPPKPNPTKNLLLNR